MSDTARPVIAFLPFYVNYYEGICPEFGREKAEVAKRAAQTLATYGEVLWDGELICDIDQARAAGARLTNHHYDCLVAVTTIAVFGGIAWAALENTEAPLLVWNVQGIETVGQGYSMTEIVRNTGQIGTQALCNTLLRQGRKFSVVTGYEKGDHTQEGLDRFFRVIGAAQALRTARLLRAGSQFPMMTDIELDAAYLSEHLGATIDEVDEVGLTQAYRSIDEAVVTNHKSLLTTRGNLQDIADDELERSVRLAEALEVLATAGGCDAGTLNCHGANCLRNPEIGVTACYALSMQNAAGRPFTCTGDLPTALAMLLLKKLTGAAMYTEVQVMDELRDALVIANSGEGEDGLRRESAPPIIRGNTNFSGLHGRGASLAYPLRTGAATFASLTPTPLGPKPFRCIAAEGEILPDLLPDAGALAGFFRFAHTGLHDGYTRWLEAGAVHHAATALGHLATEIAEVCTLLDWELITI